MPLNFYQVPMSRSFLDIGGAVDSGLNAFYKMQENNRRNQEAASQDQMRQIDMQRNQMILDEYMRQREAGAVIGNAVVAAGAQAKLPPTVARPGVTPQNIYRDQVMGGAGKLDAKSIVDALKINDALWPKFDPFANTKEVDGALIGYKDGKYSPVYENPQYTTDVLGSGNVGWIPKKPGTIIDSGTKGTDKTPKTNVSVSASIGQKGLDKLSETQGSDLVTRRTTAQQALDSIATNMQAEQLLQKGMFTGTGADAKLAMGKALSAAGITLADEPVANTEAYAALMGKQVANLIKNFGSGTGLSDADREYAEKMAAGKITVNKESLLRIIRINNVASRNSFEAYNRDATQVMNKPESSGLLYDMRLPTPSWYNYDQNTKTFDPKAIDAEIQRRANLRKQNGL